MTQEEFAALDTYKSKPVKFAHDFAFDQITTDLPDYFGRMLRVSDPVNVRWSQWKKGVTAAMAKFECSPTATLYMQKFGHMVSPPITPRFTWSPSRIISFEQCGVRFSHEYFYRTIPYTDTVHTIWGKRCHTAIEQYMKGEEVTDSEAFAVVKPYAEFFSKLPGKRLIEHEVAVDSNWKPCGFNSNDYFGRMVIDFAVINERAAYIIDWKSGSCFDRYGNVKTPSIQLEIYAYIMAIHFPEIQTFEVRYVSLKDKTQPPKQTYTRKEIIPLALDIRQRIDRMKEAWESESYRASKSGLCRSWCPVKECAHCGK